MKTIGRRRHEEFLRELRVPMREKPKPIYEDSEEREELFRELEEKMMEIFANADDTEEGTS